MKNALSNLSHGTGVHTLEKRDNVGMHKSKTVGYRAKTTTSICCPSSHPTPTPAPANDGNPAHLILLPVLDPCLVGMVLEHGLAVGLLKHFVSYAVAVLFETQNLVVRQLRNELGREVVSEEEVRVFADLLCWKRRGGGSALDVGVDPGHWTLVYVRQQQQPTQFRLACDKKYKAA